MYQPPTPEEADARRGRRLVGADGTSILRVKIPVELRRSLKIMQLKQHLTADEATSEIMREYFSQFPQ